MTEPIPRYHFAHGGVQQRIDDDLRTFDPNSFGEFTDRQGNNVRAVKLPGTFMVGADICTDGYLVYDGKLRAISTQTFNRDYSPVRRLDVA